MTSSCSSRKKKKQSSAGVTKPQDLTDQAESELVIQPDPTLCVGQTGSNMTGHGAPVATALNGRYQEDVTDVATLSPTEKFLHYVFTL